MPGNTQQQPLRQCIQVQRISAETWQQSLVSGSSSAPVVELVSRVTTFQLCALTPTVAQQRMAPLNRSILGGGKQGRAVAGWVSTPITQAAVCGVGVGEQRDGQAHRHMCM